MKKTSTKDKIESKTNLADLLSKYSELAEVLREDYGLHCVGCFAARFETLEDGAKAHGYDGKDIEKMIKKLNKIVGE